MTRSSLVLIVSVVMLLGVPAFGTGQESSIKWPLPPIPSGAMVYPDLSYVTNGSPSQKLDLYLPREGRNLPLIVYVHGGAFCMGDKRQWIRYQLGYLRGYWKQHELPNLCARDLWQLSGWAAHALRRIPVNAPASSAPFGTKQSFGSSVAR